MALTLSASTGQPSPRKRHQPLHQFWLM